MILKLFVNIDCVRQAKNSHIEQKIFKDGNPYKYSVEF